jgi:VWFA-related protein
MTFFPRSPVRCLGLTGLVLIAALLLAQDDRDLPKYSASVKVVNVLATVRDKHGKIVNNLSASDFVLDEDGRPQKIGYFARDTDLPLTLGLLVDTSRSMRAALDQERSAGATFVDQVVREDKDKAFLIHFDRQVELLQDLTPSHEKLDKSIADLETSQPSKDDQDQQGGGNSGGGYPSGGGGYPGGGGRRGGQGGDYHLHAGTTLYDAIYLASNDLMQKQQGRKAVVILSDGVDRGSKTSLERAIEYAQRSNTVVYSIYFKGEQAMGEGERRGGFGRHGGMGGGWPGGGGGYPGGGYPGGGYPGGGGGYPGGGGRYPREEQQHVDGKKILERISKETGGRMFEVSKKETLADIYTQIQDELRNQYNLGYTPDRKDDIGPEYHKISLTTKDKGMVVQAREGYYEKDQPEARQPAAKQGS